MRRRSRRLRADYGDTDPPPTVKLIFPVVVSFLFALLYADAMAFRAPALALLAWVVVFAFWLASYLLPPLLFRYSNDHAAPLVLGQLMKRAGVAAACVIAASLLALLISGLWLDLPFLEEVYALSLVGIILFHGFGGPFAHHVVYLQQTHQYHSNQLAAVLIAFTLMLFVLALFFLNLDFAITRDAYVQGRDLLLLTTVLVGYGSTIYKVAHH